MFRSNIIREKKSISLSKDQVMEDINKIQTNEDQRNKLYLCLDEKPPHDKRFKNLEEFLKGNVDLESVSNNLQTLTQDLETLTQEIQDQLESIKVKSVTS